jgi:hypothetical protein
MRLLSIDVGIVNLAMCLIEDGIIKEWEVDGIPPCFDDTLFAQMKRHVDSKPWMLTSDMVLIERQPNKNQKIKSIEHFLHTYFLVHNKNVIIYDARHKVPDIAGPGKRRYRERKNASVERCREFLKEGANAHLVSFFDGHKKKDDLADTVMQALSYTPAPPVVKKKMAPRKPTSNQSETRYSKANLAWIYKNQPKGIETARFNKDLKRYYKTIEELVEDFSLRVD